MIQTLKLMVKKNSKTIGKLFIAIGGVIFLYLFILLVTSKQGMPANIKATIDSLTAVNKQLIEHQQQIDSTINAYEAEVDQIDFQVDNIKEKTTIIREYYHEVGQQAE